MRNKVLLNKADKKRRIEEAAFQLFTQIDDFSRITIDQIVRKAEVAKGTFYLYFQDKVQLVNSMIVEKSSDIIQDALKKAQESDIHNHEDRFIYLVDTIIEYFKQNPLVLNVVKKNLSWSIIGGELQSKRYQDTQRLVADFMAYLRSLGYSEQEANTLLFMMLELTSTVCYSAIVLKQPSDIDTMKPFLFDNLRKMMRRTSL